jgi:hypothetical protein
VCSIIDRQTLVRKRSAYLPSSPPCSVCSHAMTLALGERGCVPACELHHARTNHRGTVHSQTTMAACRPRRQSTGPVRASTACQLLHAHADASVSSGLQQHTTTAATVAASPGGAGALGGAGLFHA